MRDTLRYSGKESRPTGLVRRPPPSRNGSSPRPVNDRNREDSVAPPGSFDHSVGPVTRDLRDRPLVPLPSSLHRNSLQIGFRLYRETEK